MKLKSRFLLLGILPMLAVTMRSGNAAATGNANADADGDANAVAHADANQAIPRYDDPQNPPDCGEVKYKTTRIVGGQEAKFGSHPWLGILFREEIKGYVYCGCNLLSPKWCVTAAHCMYNKSNDEVPLEKFFIRFGEHNYTNESEPLPYQSFTFETREIYPQYDTYKKPRTYDISMMKVNGTVTYDVHIVPICLPKSDVNIFGRTANVAGWGIYDYPKQLYSDILREVDVEIQNDTTCKNWFQVNSQYQDHVTSFCAGYKQGVKDSCQGDSGGALTVMEGRKHVAVGLVSYGKHCGYPNLPGVYVRVQYFVPWILNITST